MNQTRTPTLYEARIRQQAIGARLRRLFDEFVEEPTPPEFSDILRKADQRGFSSTIRGAAHHLHHQSPFDAALEAGHGVGELPPAELSPHAMPPAPALELETVGKLAHEMNRAWCELNGDYSQTPWDQAPQWQRDSTMSVVQFFADNPTASDSAMHDAWLEEKRLAGWAWGPEKNPELKQHPCIVPFEDLPVEQQFKDRLFRTVIGVSLGFI